MQKIKCLQDISDLRRSKALSQEMLDGLEADLRIIHEWADEYTERSFEEFHTDDFLCGGIVVFETCADLDQMEELGVSGGIDALVPETLQKRLFGNESWLRMNVTYNESYAVIFFILANLSDRFRTAKVE